MKKTPRGFAIYSEIKDSRRNTIRVQQSSAAGGPFCWVFVHDAEGRDAYEYLGQLHSVSPHLTRAQARRLANALLRFAETK